MTCVACKERYPSSKMGEELSTEMRAAGWYVWPKGAPIFLDGLVLCPPCARSRLGQVLLDLVQNVLHFLGRSPA